MHTAATARATLAGLVTLAALAACTPGGTDAPDDVVRAVDTPDFSGPYAAEFTREYQRTELAHVRDALRDEVVTDAEFGESTSLFVACLAEQDVEFGGYDADGGYSTSTAPHGDTYEVVSGCESSTGHDTLGMLYAIPRANPENLDVAPLVAACLVEAGVVPPDYDAAAYAADEANLFSDFGSLEPEVRDAVTACTSDPQGTR